MAPRPFLVAAALVVAAIGRDRPAAGQAVPPGWLPVAARAALAADVCRGGPAAGGLWIDRVERTLFRTVCSSARWFDAFFGDRRSDEEAARAWGRLSLDLRWDGHDGLEVRPRFRARFPLPNLDERLSLVVGRDTEDDLLAERDRGSFAGPAFFSEGNEEELFAGLGWSPVRTDRQRFGISAGAKGGVTHPEGFVTARYRYFRLVGAEGLVRLRPSLFWTSEDGFGGTLAVDLERPAGRRGLVRWTGIGTRSQGSEGLWWQTRITLFQALAGPRALALEASAEGETEAAVPLEEVLVTATYRQRVLRDWLFGELLAGVSWQRESTEESRRAAAVAGFGLELVFGRRH